MLKTGTGAPIQVHPVRQDNVHLGSCTELALQLHSNNKVTTEFTLA